MKELTCSDCATYDTSSFVCYSGKNPINPKARIKVAEDCPACENFTNKPRRGHSDQK